MDRNSPKKQSGTMTEVAYEKIREMIQMNRLGPDQRINYPDLAVKLQMSKTPIISALNRLEEAGYVYLKPNHGYYVRDVEPHQMLQALEAREMLEMANMDAVVAGATEQDLDALEKIHEAYREGMEQYFDRNSIMLNRDFHRNLARIGKNEFMIRAIDQLNDWLIFRTGAILSRFLIQFKVHEESQGHGQIIDALRKKDGKLAKEIMRSHLRRPIKFVKEQLGGLEIN